MSDPEEVDPTDANISYGPIGANLERLNAKAKQRRSDSQQSILLTQLIPKEIFVRPSPPNRIILDRDGLVFPSGGRYVDASDVYFQRRIRDGSLVVIPSEELQNE